jgi:hypothetical protein
VTVFETFPSQKTIDNKYNTSKRGEQNIHHSGREIECQKGVRSRNTLSMKDSQLSKLRILL